MTLHELYITCVQFQNTLKLIHFQTASYALHKSSDSLYKSFAKKFDRFFEVYQGIHNKRLPSLKATPVVLQSVPDAKVGAYCQKTVAYLQNAARQISTIKAHRELCTILDDMASDIIQFVYLASFR